ncbi:hypothetical protein [Pseudomonas sp. NFX224]|uniref:hypothetical protein n=1 Tax=Pseudomonas sp. NFX224 TaxID=3402862 RepID=UPI003AFAEEF8
MSITLLDSIEPNIDIMNLQIKMTTTSGAGPFPGYTQWFTEQLRTGVSLVTLRTYSDTAT